MLLLVKKGISGGTCHAVGMQKLITDKWKIMRKTKNHHISFKYWDVNNLNGWPMSLPSQHALS